MSAAPTQTHRPTARTRAGAGPFVLRLVGALLAVGVSVIHVLDQGGLTGLKDPAYVGYGYRALEVAGIVCAVLLLARLSAGWLLALPVAAGPILGFVLTRSTGLPGATEDIDNWGEPLGVVSLVVEGLLLVLALVALPRGRRPAR